MGWKSRLPILFTLIAMAPGHAVLAEEAGEVQLGEPSGRWRIPITLPTSAPSRIVIEGSGTNGRFVPHAVRIPDEKSTQAMKMPFPLGENLLSRLKSRPFGSEARAVARRVDDYLLIHCGEGTAPAGVVLETDNFHFPRSADLSLVIEGLGSGEQLGLSIVNRGGDAPATPQLLMGGNGGSLQLPPIAAVDLRGIVINCPLGQAGFQLSSVRLEPSRPSIASRTGTWLWKAEAWLAQPKQIEDWAAASGLDRVFLQLRIDQGEVAGMIALADLVGRLGRRGISVEAVEGDPAMATADGLVHALRRVAAIRRYQLASPPAAQLAGLQFDIEPYLLSDFALDPAAVWARWAEAIQALSSAWGEPVSIVVPFWMLDSEAGAAALAEAHPVISNVTVMAYRTDAGEVTSLSEPWLAWGALNAVPVNVALENGPVGVEIHRTFVRAEAGSVLLNTESRPATVSLFPNQVEARQGTLAYAFHHETRVNPARISFMNDQDKLAVARAELARLLVAWPSFDGLMIHALDESDRGNGGPRILKPEAGADEPQAQDPDLRR